MVLTDSATARRRRSFLKYAIGAIHAFIGTTLAAIVGTVTTRSSFLKQRQDWLEVGAVRALTETPQPFEVAYIQRQGWRVEERKQLVYAYRDAEGKVVVLSSTCTHLGCMVRWDTQAAQFKCPCHGGVYNGFGKVVDGPPPRDLARLSVKVEQNRILVRRA